MLRWHRFLVGVAALIALGPAAGEAPPLAPDVAVQQARSVIDATLKEVLQVLAQKILSEADKKKRIEEIAYAHFDFDTMSRLILARNWRHFSQAQRDAFVAEFKKHLSLTYGENLMRYKNETVATTSARAEKNGDVKVRTKIVRSTADPLLIDYRLRQRETTWYVIDVIIEGISLVANFRTQTQAIISDVGADRLIERLRKKNAERAQQKKTTP